MIDPDLLALCQKTHQAYYRASAFYGPTMTEPDLPIFTDGSIEYTAGSEIQGTASVTLAKGSESLIPQSKADTLAPYGQEVRIERVDVLGAREFVTPMGQFRIGGIPSMKEYRAKYPGKFRAQGWFAKLDLVDRFDKVRADEFLSPGVPNFDNSTWAEIQRLSDLPIVQADSLPDRPLSSGVTYDDRSRLATLTLLFANLGGVPTLTRMGTLTGRVKDAWLTATVPEVTINGVIDMDDSLTNDVSNCVRVSSTDDQFVAVREITDPGDPLNVNGPLGRRVYRQSSPLYTSQDAVESAAETVLTRVSTRRSKTVTVTCLPQPFLELGQYIEAVDVGRTVRGEVSRLSFSMDPTAPMKLELIVAESR